MKIMKNVVLLLILPVAACTSYKSENPQPTSDIFASYEQHVLRLGSVEKAQHHYHFSGLPPERFVIGMEIKTTQADHDLCSDFPLNNRVTMLLRTAEGDIVIDESLPLRDWARSTDGKHCKNETFVYLEGAWRKIDLGDAELGYRPVDMKAHEGWGSYFSPLAEAKYELKLTLHEPLPPGFSATLKATGQGV